MSLKEHSAEIFTRYGFSGKEISVYLKYLRLQQGTISEVFMYFEEGEIEYSKVEEITNNLVEKGFLKKVEGIIDRYAPLEPYFELFTEQSAQFASEIAKTKDEALSGQNKRFDKLDTIQNNRITEIEGAVAAQINAFFGDSDNKNTSKKERIESSRNRFTKATKTLETDLHDNTEKSFSELKSDTEQLDSELESIKDAHNNSTSELEKNIHNIMETLNSDLKNISESFVDDNEGAINTTKGNLTQLVADLLGDFSSRVDDLEKELKQDLDEHVERHVNVANELKPKMEQILEKYLERMDKIIVDLKERISRLLDEHINHLKNTTSKVEAETHSELDTRHITFKDQVNSYKNRALTLLENLLDGANRFSDFSEDIAKQGIFFTKGKKRKFVARWKQIEKDVAGISRSFKDDFVNESARYINETQNTIEDLKTDITETMSSKNGLLAGETTDLDKKAQETLSAELDTLASDMAGEIDDTLQSGVKDCSDASIKLKDSLENTLSQHHKQYDDAINRHKEESLRHYTDFDVDIKRKNESWVKDVDNKFNSEKRDVSTETHKQIDNINEFKAKFKRTIDDRLSNIRSDFDSSKSNISEKIDDEIELWNGESADMDKNLADTLEDHKVKYKENAETLQSSLSNTTRDIILDVKDAIGDFTIQFMGSIDDSITLAENNQDKLKDIHNVSSSISELAQVTTWHTIGREALIAAIKDAVYRTKSSVIIVTPVVVPEVLQMVSEFAFQRKSARFLLTSKFDIQAYGSILKKMMALGNIQFRNLSQTGDFYAVTRDAEEVILCPASQKDSEMIAIVSNQEQYARLYSQFIGPIFQANSRPIKL